MLQMHHANVSSNFSSAAPELQNKNTKTHTKNTLFESQLNSPTGKKTHLEKDANHTRKRRRTIKKRKGDCFLVYPINFLQNGMLIEAQMEFQFRDRNGGLRKEE